MKIFKKLLAILILLVVFTGCFDEKDPPELQYSVQNNPYKFGEAEVTKGFYRGGSIIYSKEYPDLNMIAPGQAFTYKMGKFVEKGEGLTELQEKEFGVIQIESVTEDEIKFKYALWEKRITSWQTADLEVGEEVDLNGDGKNDIKWTQGDEERGLEKSRYLTFISSKEKAQITMYQLREEWMPKGFYPYGILQVTPSGSIVMGDRFVKQHQKRAIDKILDGQIDIDKMPFIKDGDTLISDDQGSRRVTRKQSIFGGKRGTTGGALEVITLEEAMKDPEATAELEKIGAMEVFDYTTTIEVGGDAVNTTTDNKRFDGDLGRSLTYDFKEKLGLGKREEIKTLKAEIKVGVKYNVDVKFHEFFIGCNGTLLLDHTPYIKASLNADIELEKDILEIKDKGKVTIFPGKIIPLPNVIGKLTLGELYISPQIKMSGKVKANVEYCYSYTVHRQFDYYLGFKASKGEWHKEIAYSHTKGIETKGLKADVEMDGEITVSPTLTCENTFTFLALCNLYINYNLQSKNTLKGYYEAGASYNGNSGNSFNLGGAELISTIGGYGNWGAWAGYKQTYTIKVWKWKKTITIDFSKKFDFGNFCSWELEKPLLYGKLGWQKESPSKSVDSPEHDKYIENMKKSKEEGYVPAYKYTTRVDGKFVRDYSIGYKGVTSKLRILFKDMKLKKNRDFVEIYDKTGKLIEKITGTEFQYMSKEINGDGAVIRIIYDDDDSVCPVCIIDSIYAYSNAELTFNFPEGINFDLYKNNLNGEGISNYLKFCQSGTETEDGKKIEANGIIDFAKKYYTVTVGSAGSFINSDYQTEKTTLEKNYLGKNVNFTFIDDKSKIQGPTEKAAEYKTRIWIENENKFGF